MNYDTEMTVLYRLIENKEWDAVVERLDTNPEEASKFVEKYNIFGTNETCLEIVTDPCRLLS